ncbi:MAG TPA: biotin--[acetyl-CoA-carboxylase] ligase [Propionicimonas sp.]|nr:biotin--[acetyl-CoA-carboxylase] ligase [Propionicimonas sp.]HRA05458.1 biotin--[acetyl-CoA-carboxylase] ligase [Propionicimonas sp.]
MSAAEGLGGNPSVDAEWLARRVVRGGAPWTAVSAVATTGSTNADLTVAARAGAGSGLVRVADHQSAGRGRFTRVWEAPPGTSLAISALLRPPAAVPLRRWLWLPLLTGLAVADGLRAACGVDAELKWPNDVLIGGRKVCGILTERVEDVVIIGMGINTTLGENQLPVPTATSLALAGADVETGVVAASVLSALGDWYQRWLGGVDLREAYAQRCTSVGREVRVQLSATDSVTGWATGIDPNGCLLVEVAGRERAFAAGDVVHLR